MVEPSREVYPNAPLMYVAVEVRFPHTPRLASDTTLPLIHERLRDQYPIVEPGFETTLMVGAATPAIQSTVFRLVSRDRTSSVQLTPTSLVVDTTSYSTYEHFRDGFAAVLEAVHEAAGIVGILRIGLRYVDEIRLQDDEVDLAQWRPYVAGSLLGSQEFAVPGFVPAESQGIVRFVDGSTLTLVLRYGARKGRTVGESPLRTRQSRSGSYFLLDMDSYWADDQGTLQDFSAPWVLETCDRLHDPARQAFEAAITNQLRDEILRVQR